MITLTSGAFKNGARIPDKYTGESVDVSPKLMWSGLPKEAKSIAIICDDPDAPVGTWVHWVIFNIDPKLFSISENVPKGEKIVLNGASQGKNDFKKLGYGGPMPPAGPTHRYFFKIYALDKMLDLQAGASKADLERAMQGHIIAQGQLMGTYSR